MQGGGRNSPASKIEYNRFRIRLTIVTAKLRQLNLTKFLYKFLKICIKIYEIFLGKSLLKRVELCIIVAL